LSAGVIAKGIGVAFGLVLRKESSVGETSFYKALMTLMILLSSITEEVITLVISTSEVFIEVKLSKQFNTAA
jgi:hypothetical protein